MTIIQLQKPGFSKKRTELEVDFDVRRLNIDFQQTVAFRGFLGLQEKTTQLLEIEAASSFRVPFSLETDLVYGGQFVPYRGFKRTVKCE